MRTILICAAAVLALTSAASAAPAPKHCEPSAAAWWVKYLANGKADLARSIPELGIAHVTWASGDVHVLQLEWVDGLGYCSVSRRVVAE